MGPGGPIKDLAISPKYSTHQPTPNNIYTENILQSGDDHLKVGKEEVHHPPLVTSKHIDRIWCSSIEVRDVVGLVVIGRMLGGPGEPGSPGGPIGPGAPLGPGGPYTTVL